MVYGIKTCVELMIKHEKRENIEWIQIRKESEHLENMKITSYWEDLKRSPSNKRTWNKQ